jgi:anaerobic ribonucleoside-triphosphate reductase activating protein
VREGDVPVNYSEIKFNDIANGVGVRTSLFVSGCRHRCEGCFNSVAWGFDAGMPFDGGILADILMSLEPEHVSGLSILGGEPLEPENQRDVMYVVDAVRRVFPEKDVWMWTGFVWEELMRDGCRAHTPMLDVILRHLDVLVDGPFVRGLADLSLRFRGSSNQRIVDVPRSLSEGFVVPWTDGALYSVRGSM